MASLATILLVDDCENDITLMRAALEQAGFKGVLLVARNGEEALACLQGEFPFHERGSHPLPDITLLDLNMPKKDGFEVLEWVRFRPGLNRIPMIILTASGRLEDVDRAYELGAKAFLVKPTSVHELISMLRCFLDWSHYNRRPTIPETALGSVKTEP